MSIRRPSRAFDLYRWHSSAVRGEAPPQHDGEPHCGWYRARLVKGGPWVAARIWIEREIDPETGELTADERFCCEVDGQRRDAARVWTHLRPITKAEYDALVQRIQTTPAMAASKVKLDMTREAPRP